MHEHPNSLLKVGCLLFIVGGLPPPLSRWPDSFSQWGA